MVARVGHSCNDGITLDDAPSRQPNLDAPIKAMTGGIAAIHITSPKKTCDGEGWLSDSSAKTAFGWTKALRGLPGLAARSVNLRYIPLRWDTYLPQSVGGLNLLSNRPGTH